MVALNDRAQQSPESRNAMRAVIELDLPGRLVCTIAVVATATIDGDRTPPSGFPHAHASEQARRIAEAGLILRDQVGSGLDRSYTSYWSGLMA
jgi:hypothetical protein